MIDRRCIESEGAPTAPEAWFFGLGTEPDFEQRRIFASVRRRLVGKGSEPKIGRFRVIRRLGSGGMGEVYLCRDDELERHVAVKRVLDPGHPHDQERLRQEARALAQLSHPHVVRVYEVGIHEDRTYLAMEYVDGHSLADWLRQGHEWREILDRFLSAGRGLAAAHQVGIVHRDFKPENVLIGKDGVVRVADFGVAFAVDQPPHPHDDPVAGTIRYMPLEQIRGENTDARSDQFAFCIALYEALWREPPFATASARARIESLERGPVEPRSNTGGLWPVISRGLAFSPDVRWPDMDVLLEALERAPKRRRRLAWAAGMGAVLGLCVAASLSLLQPVEPCSALERELDGVWDDAQRDRLERHLTELETSHADESTQRVLASLDRWRHGWITERRTVCETIEGLERVPSDLRLRDHCLSRQRHHVLHITTQLADADAARLSDAVVITLDVPDPAFCGSDLTLLGFEAPPAAMTGLVESLWAELEQGRVLRSFGQLDAASEVASRVNLAAVALDYGPLHAEANAEQARVHGESNSRLESRQLYENAIDLADLHGNDRLRAELMVERAWLSLFDFSDVEDGRRWLHDAEIVHERAELFDERAQARLSFTRGRVHELEKNRELARGEYLEAIDMLDEHRVPELPSYYDALARVSEVTESLRFREIALDVAIEMFGPRHPRTAKWLYNYGATAHNLERGGERELELALELWQEYEARPTHKRGKVRLLLAHKALLREELDIAHEHAIALRAINDELLAIDHPDRGEAEQVLATIAGIRGEIDLALGHARAAVKFFERSTAGDSDPRALDMHNEIGNLLLSAGRLDEAIGEFRDVLAHAGSESDAAFEARLGLIEFALRRGALDEAQAGLDVLAGDEPRTFPHALVLALVALRRDRLTPEQLGWLGEARERTLLSEARIETWLDELIVTESERRALGLGS